MCLGSTAMALHHKLCHVLGGTFDLPHAETHAILLPHATAYNAAAAPDAMARLGGRWRRTIPRPASTSLSARSKLPLALKDIGMPADGIDRAVELADAEPVLEPAAA